MPTTHPTRADFVAVGKYTKATDPDTISRLRADGEKTTAEAVGRYVYNVDTYTFFDTLDYLND